MKQCIKCGKTKHISEFALRSGRVARGECKPCTARIAREYRKNNREKLKLQEAQRNYGISESAARKMYAKKSCEICGDAFKSSQSKHIDHCHETNTVRGTICCHCNRGLGAFRDNVDTMKSAIKYLSHFPKPAISCGTVVDGKTATIHMMEL